MVTKAKKQARITLKHLIDKNLPIWVSNKTHEISKSGESGVISLEIISGSEKQAIQIPPGPDPFCLSDHVDARSLRNCMDLFKLTKLPNPALELLDPNHVEEYYIQNEQRWEAMQAKVKEQGMKPKKKNPFLTEIDDEEVVTVKKDIVSPSIMSMCAKLQFEKANEKEAIEFMLNKKGTFTIEDLNYFTEGIDEIKGLKDLKKMLKEEYKNIK